MPEESPTEGRRARRRRTALAVLAALTAAFWLACLLVVFPALRTRAAVQRFHEEGLTWYTEHFHEAPEKKETWKDGRAREAVRELGGERHAAARLASYLRWPRWFAAHRHHAADILGQCGAHGVPALVRALSDREARVRFWAIRSLGKIGPDARAAAGALEALGEDPSPGARRAAAEALAKIRNAGAEEP